ncbi:unnamed protein product [Ceutorhynchus assimilis]|uniref:Uncharacterized protein n=1 Tax=Ceutorhynchus assimilis TaxID=467358 RepID=A0A9N9QGD0_9CUCU|nr:unnamed protein product [Ceutorhynchus assimilis]
MHELANMAVDKAQQQVQQNQQQNQAAFPPPPAEFISPVEKPEGSTEKESSTSESSLESSSGYGSSHTTFNMEDHNQHMDDVTKSNMNNAASKYCTLPRHNDSVDGQRRRPLSMTAMNTLGTLRNNLLRRGSMQNQKPPPPIRRTSSITNTCGSIGSLENLPPPPAFLLEPTISSGIQSPSQQQLGTVKDIIPNPGIKVAETVKALTELKHTPASPNSIRRNMVANNISGSVQNIFQPSTANERPHGFSTGMGNVERQSSFQPTGNTMAMSGSNPVLSTFQSQTKVSYLSQSSGVVYAQPSQIIGGSPNAVRRITSFRSQSADRKSDENWQKNNCGNFSEKRGKKNSGKLTYLSKIKENSSSHISIYFWKTNKAKVVKFFQEKEENKELIIGKFRNFPPDPKVCHESLMDQIKRGATLKRAKIINDRSAPKIY